MQPSPTPLRPRFHPHSRSLPQLRGAPLRLSRALLVASALALPVGGGAAWADTPVDMLVIAARIDDIITLDPAQSFEPGGADVDKNLYDRLFDFDPLDLSKGLQPSLAESWTVSDDGLTLTLTLREGVKFHSGNPVRAEDAAWSLQRAVKLDKTPAFILTQFGLSADNVDENVTADGNRLTIRLDRPYAPSFVLNCLTATVASVVDKELVMQHAENGDFGNAWLATNDAGSGPYTLGAWQPGQAVQLLSFDDYWMGAPAMKRVIVRNIAESAAQRLQLERGDIDVARNLTPEDVAGVQGTDGLKVQDELRGRMVYLGMNQKDPLLSQPAVVRAIKHLVDYQGMEDSFLKGQWRTHQAIVPLGYLGEWTENPYGYEVEKARQILAGAGIDGGTITAMIPEGREFADIAQALQGSMAQVGLTLKIEQMTGAQHYDKYRAREVPLFIGLWGPDYADPQTNVGTFAVNADNRDAARLTGSLAWRNAYDVPADMQDMAKSAVVEQDAGKRAEIYRQLQAEYQQVAPLMPMFQRVEQTGLRQNVQNWTNGGSVAAVSYRQVTKD
ncbi:ABC transporter substrate-binding protein [Paracoccus jiaweipingae]|uniref:ABC transporter substrate-binding protein n=1 Tax=unclassified Paracoccus (in: a-proteobacteria) TaxID=2688777 RepID=UPI00378F7FE5